MKKRAGEDDTRIDKEEEIFMTLLWGHPNKEDSAANHSKIYHPSDEHT